MQVTDEYKCRKRSVHVNTRPLSAANVPVWMDVCHAWQTRAKVVVIPKRFLSEVPAAVIGLEFPLGLRSEPKTGV